MAGRVPEQLLEKKTAARSREFGGRMAPSVQEAELLTATLNFFPVASYTTGEKARATEVEDGSQSPAYRAGGENLVPVEVQLVDGRQCEATHPIEHGYGLRVHKSAVVDWYDYQHVRETLYPEYENLIRALVPQAEYVFVGGHICRNPERVKNGESFAEVVNAPHKFIHCDFGNGTLNEKTGRGRYSEFFYDWLTPEMPEPVQMTAIDASQGKNHGLSADEIRRYRLIVLNCWRGILPSGVDRDPLCVVDPASCTDPSAVMRDAPVGGYNGQKHSPGVAFTVADAWSGQRVVHYPKMSKDEVLIFKTYDSAAGFVPTLHGSFDDPTTSADAPARESCEARCVLLVPEHGPRSLPPPPYYQAYSRHPDIPGLEARL